LRKVTTEFDSIHADICPIVIAVLGNGRVGAGVLYVLKRLPHEILTVNQLHSLFENNSKEELQQKYRNKLIITIFNMHDL